jgi:RecA/RadA recombinase
VSGVDPNLRAQIRAAIEKDYGAHTMLPGGKMPRPRRLPTGSLALDYLSGGGYAFGHMTRFWGAQSSGKTLAMFLAFISAQNFGELRYRQLIGLAEMSMAAGESSQAKIFKDQAKREREYGKLACLFVNAERSIDIDHMKRLGVKMEELDIIEDSTIEGVGEMVYNCLERDKDGRPAYHVIGIDSTSATMSIDEVVDNKGKKKTIYDEAPTTGMIRAGKWGINMDWWRSRLTREHLIMMTSHATERIGVRRAMGSTPEKPPGGRKLHHEPGLVFHFLKSGALKRKPNGGLEELKTDDARGSVNASAFGKFQAAGGVLVVTCEKNKVGVDSRSAVLHHDKRSGNFDVLHEYEKFASYFRVLKKDGSWWTLPDGTKTQQLRSVLEKDAGLRAKIEAVVLKCADDPMYESALLAGQTEQLVELPSAESV